MVTVPDIGNPLPDWDAATEAAVRASVEQFGIVVPVVKDQHGRIIDGHHRVRLADELGISYSEQVREVASDEEALALAITLNADRRQVSSRQRREIVASLRREGHSQRAIADAVGASRTTIRRDIEAQVGREAHLPETTVGRDGKEYVARRPKTPKPASSPASDSESAPLILLPTRWSPKWVAAITRTRNALAVCDRGALKELDAGIERARKAEKPKEPEPAAEEPPPAKSRFGRKAAPQRAKGCTFDTPRGCKCKLCGKVH